MLLIGKAPNRRSNNLKVTAAATRQPLFLGTVGGARAQG